MYDSPLSFSLSCTALMAVERVYSVSSQMSFTFTVLPIALPFEPKSVQLASVFQSVSAFLP